MTNAFSRRQFLLGGLVLAGTGAVAACTSDPGPAASAPGPLPSPHWARTPESGHGDLITMR